MEAKIFAFYGPRRAGKSTHAHLMKEEIGGEVLSLASPLREMFKTASQGHNFQLYTTDLKDKPHPYLGISYRDFACATGEALRAHNPNVFLDLLTHAADRTTEEGKHVYIDDIRYKNEYETLKSMGAHFIEVKNREALRGMQGVTHRSEIDWKFFEPDMQVDNHDKKWETASKNVENIIAKYFPLNEI